MPGDLPQAVIPIIAILGRNGRGEAVGEHVALPDDTPGAIAPVLGVDQICGAVLPEGFHRAPEAVDAGITGGGRAKGLFGNGGGWTVDFPANHHA